MTPSSGEDYFPRDDVSEFNRLNQMSQVDGLGDTLFDDGDMAEEAVSALNDMGIIDASVRTKE